jgi:hypothetical protein
MTTDTPELSVKIDNGSLILSGARVVTDPDELRRQGTSWAARPIDDKRLLVSLLEGKPSPSVANVDFFSCNGDVCKEVLFSLHKSGWTGLASIDTSFGIKKIYFGGGDIVFAGSNIMDDRLGEVIYREAKITLDELTNSAAQVTKALKFGQVLLMSGIFSNVDLWRALKLQVKQILRSVFMVDRVFIELSTGSFAPTEVYFDEGTDHLIADSSSFGTVFRDFLSRLRAESEVVMLKPKEEMLSLYRPGTFVGDLVMMIAEQNNVQELLNTSKLIDSYTIAALINLVNKGLCTIKPAIETDRKMGATLAPLKAKVDAHAYVLQAVRKAFIESKKDFPIDDVVNFASSLNPEGFASIFLDQTGAIGRECLNGMFSQCYNNVERQHLFMGRVESLCKFLLQVAGDNLDFNLAKGLRQDYRSITS